MLSPKKVKYRKKQKGRIKGRANKGNSLEFGDYGLQALECGFMSSQQIESARVAITRHVKRGGKIWIRIFPDKPKTMKGAEMPMGKGKGAVDHFVVVVKPGRVLFEMEGVDESVAREALRLAANKMSVKTKFISKD